MTATLRTGITALLVTAGALVALVAAPSAHAVTVTPLVPAHGAGVQVTPPPGFGNGPLTFQWSIAFDCPGADPGTGGKISNVVIRKLGQPAFAVTGGGPFLGSNTFTKTVNLFLEPAPVVYEWRVDWVCGVVGGFPGSQGSSEVRTFTLLPLSAPAPAPAPPPPAPTAAPPVKRTPPCAGLEGKKRVRCLAAQRRKARLKACAKLRRERRPACVARANAAYRRAIRATR